MRPFSNYYSSTTTTALAFLTTIPALASSSSSSNLNNNNNSPTLLLPPFNSTDSKLITKCSIRAQQKQRKNQNIGKNSISTSLSLLERLGMGEEEQNVEPPSLSVLPIRQVRYEHAHRRGALYCKSGNWLEISNNNNIDGSDVRGTRNKNNNHFTIFEFLAVAFGLVSIKAVANQHFLCMDSKGNLYASPEKNYNAECVFLEEMHPQVYNLYSSCAHGYPKRPWFVALSRNGRPRRGKSTKKGQMSTHFVLIDEGNNNKGNTLDSLGHSKSNADWLINWKNFYEINYEHKIRGRKKLSTIKKGRLLRWELINNNNGIEEEELRKRRSEQKIIRKNRK